MYACVFQTILVLIFCLGSAEIVQRSAFFETKQNAKVYTGRLIKRQKTHSSVSCTQKCLSEPLCASFNYDSSSKSQGFCELFKDGGEVKLIEEPGWICGHILKKQQIVKRKLAKLCYLNKLCCFNLSIRKMA